jgi:hypothetical protein
MGTSKIPPLLLIAHFPGNRPRSAFVQWDKDKNWWFHFVPLIRCPSQNVNTVLTQISVWQFVYKCAWISLGD